MIGNSLGPVQWSCVCDVQGPGYEGRGHPEGDREQWAQGKACHPRQRRHHGCHSPNPEYCQHPPESVSDPA